MLPLWTLEIEVVAVISGSLSYEVMDKLAAIENIRSLVNRIPPLMKVPRNGEEFKRWEHDSKAALKWIFRENPEYLTEFEDIDYSLRSFSMATPDHKFQEAYVRGLAFARAMLESRITEIETYWDASYSQTPTADQSVPMNPNSVFVIHGRQQLTEFHNFLRAIGLDPLEWSQARKLTGKPTPYTWEIVDSALRNAGAIVALLTPDDEARLREELWTSSENALEKILLGQPRQNVLFEAGVAYGRSPERTVLVRIGSQRPMSDLAGHHIISLDQSPESRQSVADALRAAGCSVDLSGSDWYKVGRFE